ncbi:MAG: hypothetical protein K8U57_35555 [Planctomycetes bacterium]|nr:hypothetical protein [Planctomycetota bacterium]
MATPFERIQAAWSSTDRRDQLNHIVEIMASEGVTREALDEALGKLLDEVRESGVDDSTEEIINSVGDRLHGWCHESRHIKTQITTPSISANEISTHLAQVTPIQPSPG